MTKKLEELFGFDQLEKAEESVEPTVEDEDGDVVDTDDDSVDDDDTDFDISDDELDDIAKKAVETFENLTDLGFNVDSRYASELFAVAGTMLGHALTAKQTKLQKKLKVLDLQLRKLKLDQDAARNKGPDADIETAHGVVLSRNDLLERLIGNRDQKNKDS